MMQDFASTINYFAGMEQQIETIPEDGEISNSGFRESSRSAPQPKAYRSTTIGSAATPGVRPRPILQIRTHGNPTANHAQDSIQNRLNVSILGRSPGSQSQIPLAHKGSSLHSSPSTTQADINKVQIPKGPRTLADPRGAYVRPVSHTNSMTWKRTVATPQEKERITQDKEKERWLKVHTNLKKLELDLRAKAIVPTDFDEWVTHRFGRLQDEQKDEKRKIDNRKAAAQAGYSGFMPGYRPPKIGPALGGKIFACAKNLGAVLSTSTIWCPWYRPTNERPQAPWPCADEMREEGDERKTSGFGRFPAIPRVPGNPTVVWKQKQHIPWYPFDQLWQPPTAENIAEAAIPVQPSEYEKMEGMLCQDLLDAIDCKGAHDC